MDAVAAADGDRVLVLEGAALQGGEQRVEIGEQEVGGAGQLDGEAGVEHVGGGHALVHEAGVRADDLGEVGQEGDDVVLGLALDLVDAGDVEPRVLFPDRRGGFLRDHPEFGLGVAGMRLDLEPDATGAPSRGGNSAGSSWPLSGLRFVAAGGRQGRPSPSRGGAGRQSVAVRIRSVGCRAG